jgi:hypothetical protein
LLSWITFGLNDGYESNLIYKSLKLWSCIVKFLWELTLGSLYFATPPSRFWLEQLFPWDSNGVGPSTATCCVDWGIYAPGLVPTPKAKFYKAWVLTINASIAFKTASSFYSYKLAILLSWTPDILAKTIKLESITNRKDQNKKQYQSRRGYSATSKAPKYFQVSIKKDEALILLKISLNKLLRTY